MSDPLKGGILLRLGWWCWKALMAPIFLYGKLRRADRGERE